MENRGALVRVQGGPGDPGTHLENRLGEPAANPYLYLAADLAAGLDGVDRELDAAAARSRPTPTPPTPRRCRPRWTRRSTRWTGQHASTASSSATDFVDYYLMMKRAESAPARAPRSTPRDDPDAASAAWQMREYFEFY